MRNGSLLAATVAMITIATVVPAQKKPAAPRKQTDAKQDAKARYATVDGLQMYYEIHGKGRPLVLLHGAFSNIETDFGKLLPKLAKNRRIIAIEQQAHGRTADIARPLTYEQMADNTAELLRRLEVRNADFLGYSMGGGIATYIAIRHPELVRKFVFAGGAGHGPEGFYPEVLEGEEKMKPEDFAGTPWLEAYRRIAPNPGAWPRLVDKIRDLDLNWKGLRPEEIQLIKAPALLIIGDADVVRPEHVVQMFRLLGGGVAGDLVGLPASQLAVLPGTTHVSLIERTDWLLSMVTAFLDAPMPKAK
jgi:pimeloyl-ACP methyl ester carboxylesterase